MATIENVLLTLNETGGRARFNVTYALRGSTPDVQHQHRYREVVELIGDDIGLGEDGVNELIVGGSMFSGTTTFSSTNPVNRSRAMELPSSAIDEDQGLSPFPFPFPKRDEIRARVTISQLAGPPIALSSNEVHRGGVQVP